MHLLYTGGMGHDDKVGQIIPGTEIVQESQSHTFKYVISPGDKSKLIYWKTEVDMSLIVSARKVAAISRRQHREQSGQRWLTWCTFGQKLDY